jgi:hypothetical protein
MTKHDAQDAQDAQVVVTGKIPVDPEGVARRVRLMLDRLVARGRREARVVVWKTEKVILAAPVWAFAAEKALLEGRAVGVYDATAREAWIEEDVAYAAR